MTEIRSVSISGTNRDLISSFDALEGDFTPNIMKAIHFYLNKKGFLRKTSPHIWSNVSEWKEFFDNMSKDEAKRFYKRHYILDKMFREVVEKYE